MPEIKHNFTTGKMNKDLDERLIQNGEYRDAMNVQVSTSDESDIGTVQNILGNSLISDISYLTEDAVCIASIADEKNDSVYWFVYDNNNVIEQSFIFKYDKQNVKIVFADLDNTVLKFTRNYITGINIIDGLLFFTDGITEPKKINIQDCLDHTVQNGTANTEILVEKGDPDVTTRRLEEHITVIKKAPYSAPHIEYNYFRDPALTHSGIITAAKNQSIINSFLDSSLGLIHDLSGLNVGDTFDTIIESDLNGDNDFTLSWSAGTDIVIKEFDPSGIAPAIPIQNYSLRGYIEDWDENVFTNETKELDIKYTDAQNGWNEIVIRKEYSFTGTQWNKLSNRTWHVGTSTGEEIIAGNQYKVKFTLAELNGVLEGRLVVRLFDNTGGYSGTNTNHYVQIANITDLTPSAAGEYEFDFTPANYPGSWAGNNPNYGFVTPQSGWPNFTWYASMLQFEAKQDSGGTVFKGIVKDFSVTRLDSQLAKVKVRITAKDPSSDFSVTTGNTLNYAVDIYEEDTSIFKDKLARFAYRYKYKDNEYSYFSPFTNVVFSAGAFGYNSREAYNLGMVNNVKSVTLSKLAYNAPEDVEEIEILFKSEDSPSVYLVDTIKANTTTDSYTLTSETISNILPEEQFLRTYDNVPRTAKAQEIVANRLVYGNYKENYDLVSLDENNNLTDFKIDLEANLFSNQHPGEVGAPSIKSQRKYQVGVVYSDEYGRQTPVLTNSNATVNLDIENSRDQNQIQVYIKSNEHPVNMKYFKFYIKDTGGEYYNLAMDRWYDAEDGNAWLAFPSSDRDKLKIEDYLILKKGVNDEDISLIRDNKYKVIDIQNEAPEYIKLEERFVVKKRHDNTPSTLKLFVDGKIPTINENTFSLNYSKFNNGVLAFFHNTFANKETGTEYFVSFGDGINTSNKYKIFDVVLNDNSDEFAISVEKPFGFDVAQFSDDPDNISSPTIIVDNTFMSIFVSRPENSPKFDGRFFVKINKDADYIRFTAPKVDENNVEYTTSRAKTKKIFYCKSSDSIPSFNGPLYHGGTNPTTDSDASSGDWWGLGTTHDDYSAYTTPSQFQMGRSSTRPLDSVSNPKATLAGFMDAARNVIRSVGDYSYTYDSTDMADPNYRHKSWINYLAWKAWFRGINTEQAPQQAASDRVEGIDLEINATDTKFQDVWFINESRTTTSMPYLIGNPQGPGGWVVSNTYPTQNSNQTGPGDYIQRGGWDSWSSSNISHLNLTFGAIEPHTGNAFHQLSWNSNSYQNWYHRPLFYDLQSHATFGSTQGPFVEELAAGSQFRFKQDPSKTIYTIQDVQISYLLMYDNLEESSVHTPDSNANHLRGQINVAKGNSFAEPSGAQYGNEFQADGITPATDSDDSEVRYTTASFLDPVNYAINYKLILDKAIVWNPVEGHGTPISGGREITLTASAANPVGSVSNGLFKIETDTIVGTDASTSTDIAVEVGMVLDGYNNGGAGVQALTKKAVVTDIQFDATLNKHIIKFKAYNGAEETLDSAVSAGNIPDIVAADSLIFKQYSMNGLSPNSAKNLNFFRNGGEGSTVGNSGVTALGYDMEFVTAVSSEREEDIVPASPAIWETEHEEKKDIDIYYEASNTLPIVSSDSLEDIIPVGSLIEHIGSEAVPTGTTVSSVSGNVLTTSNFVQIDRPTVPSHFGTRDFSTSTSS